MGSINYTLISGELNITAILKSGSTTLQTQVHDSYGSYSFTGLTVGGYSIEFLDSLGCYDSESLNICESCAAGYTPIIGGCLAIQTGTTYLSGTTYNLVAKANAAYSDFGMLLFNSYNYNGTGTYTKYNTGTYWDNYNSSITAGPMNRSAVWATTATAYQDIQFSYCITLAAQKNYYIGLGSDNYSYIKLNGTTIISQDRTALIAMLGGDSQVTFRYWYIYPVTLLEGENVLEIGGHNIGSVAAVGIEIYNNTALDIANATSDGDLDILFRSKSLVGSTLYYEYSIDGGYHGYYCDPGYSLSTCSGVQCVKRIQYSCGSTPP